MVDLLFWKLHETRWTANKKKKWKSFENPSIYFIFAPLFCLSRQNSNSPFVFPQLLLPVKHTKSFVIYGAEGDTS